MDLTWDQKYLHRIWISVIVGKIKNDLAAIEPGPPSVSRWNTLWSRVLKIYVATAQPSYQLERIATMLVKFTEPMWFQIKRHPYKVDGQHKTFVTLQFLKHLNNNEMSIVKEVVQKNAFFAHSDQLLLAMCSDKNVANRRKAVSKVRKLRNYCIPSNEDEKFAYVKADDERPNIDKELVIPTDDEVDEDANATEKSWEKAPKNIKKSNPTKAEVSWNELLSHN